MWRSLRTGEKTAACQRGVRFQNIGSQADAISIGNLADSDVQIQRHTKPLSRAGNCGNNITSSCRKTQSRNSGFCERLSRQKFLLEFNSGQSVANVRIYDDFAGGRMSVMADSRHDRIR